jgi:hypothetical protein
MLKEEDGEDDEEQDNQDDKDGKKKYSIEEGQGMAEK